MGRAKKGDRVTVDYVARLADGTIFDTTIGDQTDNGEGGESGPVELTLGEGEIFIRVEDALVGMSPGEKRTVTVVAGETFGDHNEEMVFTVPREDMPESLDPVAGQELELLDEAGETVLVTVIEVNEKNIVIDANHPLTGKDLTFELELVEIL